MVGRGAVCVGGVFGVGSSPPPATATVTGQNVIGLTTIEDDSRTYLPLAATYTGTGATELTVANIVQTATLAKGDELYAYDPDRKQYDVYTLGTDGKWTGVKTVEVSVPGKATETTSPAAAERVIARGRGFWIVRNADASRAHPVRLVGEVPAAATVKIPAAVDGKPSATLIGVPSDWTLNETDWTDKAVPEDKIRVLNEDDEAWHVIRYDGKKKKWIEYRQKMDATTKTITGTTDENPVLKGGYAVWYMRAGTDSFTLTLPR